jgi:DDE superfamily endonuclease
MINLYGTHATVPYVPTPQFGTVVTRKMAGLVQYRSYVLYNRCDDCEHCFRRRGWSPRGMNPAQIAQFHCGQRHQIVPAYSQEGILLARVFPGNTDAAIFLEFIEQLLEGHCNPFPGKHLVLIMDNASFHRTDEIEQTCARAGVKLI